MERVDGRARAEGGPWNKDEGQKTDKQRKEKKREGNNKHARVATHTAHSYAPPSRVGLRQSQDGRVGRPSSVLPGRGLGLGTGSRARARCLRGPP